MFTGTNCLQPYCLLEGSLAGGNQQSNLFPIVFPKDSKSLKLFDIRLWEVGEKDV